MKMASMFNKRADSRLHAPSLDWPLPNQLIGLEFEYEQAMGRHKGFSSYWDVKTDGSLRDGGAEFVFANPLMGEDLTKALAEMEAGSVKFEVNDRTGLHIHLDVRDMEQTNIFRLFLLYALSEYLIYRFIGDHRDKSNFCVSWYRSYEQHGLMQQILQGKEPNFSSLQKRVEVCSRYMGLNLQSLLRFGSLEFRQMQNTHDFGRIRDWIKMVMELKKAAEQTNVIGDEFIAEVRALGSREFMQKYLPTLYSKAQDWDDFHYLFDLGIEGAQEILISGSPRPYFTQGFSALIQDPKFVGQPSGLDKFLAKSKPQPTSGV